MRRLRGHRLLRGPGADDVAQRAGAGQPLTRAFQQVGLVLDVLLGGEQVEGQPLAPGQERGQRERPFAAGSGIDVDEAIGARLEHAVQIAIRIKGIRNSPATNAATERPLRVA